MSSLDEWKGCGFLWLQVVMTQQNKGQYHFHDSRRMQAKLWPKQVTGQFQYDQYSKNATYIIEITMDMQAFQQCPNMTPKHENKPKMQKLIHDS